jgi:6-phosphogluconolactonase
MKYSMQKFDDKEILARSLASEITHQLDRAINGNDHATLAVSGGSTPVSFFKELSQSELDWHKVTITLVDERWVNEDHERSNAKLVNEHLLQNRASFANFTPLFENTKDPDDAVTIVEPRLANLPRPFDVVILGMGLDGHTASFFPDATELADALNPRTQATVYPIHSPSIEEPRMTLTLPIVSQARFVALHIEGNDKRDVLEKTVNEKEELPIHQVINNCEQTPVVYWAP